MAKSKRKQEKPGLVSETGASSGGLSDGVPCAASESGAEPAPVAEGDAPRAAGQQGAAAVPARLKSRWRRWLPDLLKAVLALAVIGVAAAIWYKPPLSRADFPYVSYCFKGQWANDAKLFRPLAMPTRYYIALPRKLEGRYAWFAVDRRREVVALAEAPAHRFLGRSAIKRSDPLGLDLEFRQLDGSEWQIHFFEDSIVFSNAMLAVRMDTGKAFSQ